MCFTSLPLSLNMQFLNYSTMEPSETVEVEAARFSGHQIVMKDGFGTATLVPLSVASNLKDF